MAWDNLRDEVHAEFDNRAVFDKPKGREQGFRTFRYDDAERGRARTGMAAMRAARYAAGWTRTRTGWHPPVTGPQSR